MQKGSGDVQENSLGDSVPFLASKTAMTPAFGPCGRGLGLAASLLLHLACVVALIWAPVRQTGSEGSDSRIVIEVLPLEAPAPKSEPEPLAKAEVMPPAIEPPRPVAKTKPQPIAAPLSVSSPIPAATVSPPDSAMAASLSDDAVAAPPPPIAKASRAGEDLMAQYEQRLWQQILRHKPSHVPFRGTVQLRFRLSPSGELLSFSVVQSSGMGYLDQAALTALQEAAPFPSAPPEAVAEQLNFTIPFTFQ